MKEITHEEVREKLVWGNKVLWTEKQFLDDYITQQQAKEERAKKEHELLDFYRKSHKGHYDDSFGINEYDVLDEQIIALEEDLTNGKI